VLTVPAPSHVIQHAAKPPSSKGLSHTKRNQPAIIDAFDLTGEAPGETPTAKKEVGTMMKLNLAALEELAGWQRQRLTCTALLESSWLNPSVLEQHGSGQWELKRYQSVLCTEGVAVAKSTILASTILAVSAYGDDDDVDYEQVTRYIGDPILGGHPTHHGYTDDKSMDTLGRAIQARSLLPKWPGKKTAWMTAAVYGGWNNKNSNHPLWERNPRWFWGEKDDSRLADQKPPMPRLCDRHWDRIVFPTCNSPHWTGLIADVDSGTMWYFDGAKRKSCAPSPHDKIHKFFLAVTALLKHAGERPGGDRRLLVEGNGGHWQLECYYGDKIPKQNDGWTCGHRMLVIADMLALGYKVEDLHKLYGNDDMLSIRQAMGHFLLSVGQRGEQ
jgi:hypothetical protein